MDSLEEEMSDSDDYPREKRRKPGIIYLSTIPPGMNISTLREYFSKFGQIDRVFLQPVQDKSIKKGKKTLFSEGWVEFKSKRKAKHVEEVLNNKPVGGKKSSPYFDMLWNIKYLPRFKWAFLNQRLEYEKLAFRKRMGAEISQVNKETDHYLKASMLGAKLKKKKEMAKDKGEKSKEGETKTGYVFKQKLTEEEIQKRKEARKKKDKKFQNAIEKRKRRKQKLKENKGNKIDDFAASIFVGSNT